jgi:hypothetical protein
MGHSLNACLLNTLTKYTCRAKSPKCCSRKECWRSVRCERERERHTHTHRNRHRRRIICVHLQAEAMQKGCIKVIEGYIKVIERVY